MNHDIIEAVDYCRKNDRETIITKDFREQDSWYYTCLTPLDASPNSKSVFIWNNASHQWQKIKPLVWDNDAQVNRLQEGPECFMTREEALKCLQGVPTKTEELQGKTLDSPVEIEAFGYRRADGEPTTIIERHLSIGHWLYGCFYNGRCNVWNKVQKTWNPYKHGVREEHHLTEVEAKICLREVPTLKELNEGAILRIEESTLQTVEKEPTPTDPVKEPLKPRIVDCDFWVRPGTVKVQFQIPSDMKKSEAERFALAVKCFWFEDDTNARHQV